ncbi:MAG: Cof-type HAD-IIB family hydrolase [Cyclobacteriaceae bacterium]|nr:Cof-type HAD-IIB family hydrolase [Cyclobacteriaceae bacterium]MDH4294793.1 Cof-type HAD-IIB family hydrolase [Cyclobacteriaceae bacterium]
MRIRAVCTDIDGTLLDANRVLSLRTIAAIRDIKDKVPVILASSRMPEAMRHLQRDLGITDHPIICFNGGYIIYFENGSQAPCILDSVKMPLSVCNAILDLAARTSIHVSLFMENEWYAAAHDQWTEREARITKVSPVIRPLHEVMDKWRSAHLGPHKVMCMGTITELDQMYTALHARFFNVIHLYRSKSTYLEIAPKAISKATALEMVMEKKSYGNISEVIAFGDNYNDIEMIRDVGWGIAVENAIPEVKAVAKEITLSSKADGVAVVLEKYMADGTIC